jgi:hypothetical protein
MATETSEGQGEDCGEDAGFEEQDKRQRGDTAVTFKAHGAANEDHDHGHEDPKDETGFDELHHECGNESADRKQTLCHRQEVGAACLSRARFDVLAVIDEEVGYRNLRSHVAELCGNAPE